MTILDDQQDEIIRRVATLEIGATFSLRTLYGENWEGLYPPGERKHLGKLFREAVDATAFPMVQWDHHSDSPSEHWYRRIE